MTWDIPSRNLYSNKEIFALENVNAGEEKFLFPLLKWIQGTIAMYHADNL